MDPMNRQSQLSAEEHRSLTERVNERMQQTADDARTKSPAELVDDARAKTSETIDAAKQKTAEVTSAASEKATDVMSAAGDQMSTLAQTVRERAPGEGRAGEIASSTADALERGGRYLQEADPQLVRSDLERIIREHPIESMLVGVGAGYLIARAMRR